MLEWKEGESTRSRCRLSASKLILIPITCLIINTVSQLWNIFTSEKASHDYISTGSRSLLSVEDEPCTRPAIMDFPQITLPGGEGGRLIIPLIISIYLYFLIAKICDDYFIGSIRVVCSKIGFSGDVAGATLMAAAISSPELFIHMVGTLMTESNIGIGTIVGSVVFNVLAVPGLCGIFSVDTKVILLDLWPLVRDSVMYCIALTTLTLCLWDRIIYWYEAGIMILVYLFYLLMMGKNKVLRGKFESFISPMRNTPNPWENNVSWPLLVTKEGVEESPIGNGHIIHVKDFYEEEEDEKGRLCCWPSDSSILEKICWVLALPINVVLRYTIPNCRNENSQKLYILTFVMCISWIALSCYAIAWMITITGYVLKVPDSVMGLTFIAAGMSIPETISSVIVAKQGQGSMAMANLLGSNIFDMLCCFGLPWLLKSAFMNSDASGHYIEVNCNGLTSYIFLLFIAIFVLFTTLAANKFVLSRLVGYICMAMYIIFIVSLVLLELRFVENSSMPLCLPD